MRKLGDYLLGFSVVFSIAFMMCFLAYFTNQSDKAMGEQMNREVYADTLQEAYKIYNEMRGAY